MIGTGRFAGAEMRRLLHAAFILVGLAGVVTGIYSAILINSWGGHRPLTADALHPYAYDNHGVFYVSAGDLALSRMLLFSAWTMAAVGVVGSWIARRLKR
jgi:hypothetical protein